MGNGKGEGRERGKGRVGRPPALLPPTGFCLKYHPEQDTIKMSLATDTKHSVCIGQDG